MQGQMEMAKAHNKEIEAELHAQNQRELEAQLEMVPYIYTIRYMKPSWRWCQRYNQFGDAGERGGTCICRV